MSRRLNVRTRVKNVSRSRVTGRTPIDDSKRNNRYDINKSGTPQNYKNQRYREV